MNKKTMAALLLLALLLAGCFGSLTDYNEEAKLPTATPEISSDDAVMDKLDDTAGAGETPEDLTGTGDAPEVVLEDYDEDAPYTSYTVIETSAYDRIGDFKEGFAAVAVFDNEQSKLKWGFIDTTGKEVIPLVYDKVRGFSDGMAVVQFCNCTEWCPYYDITGFPEGHTIGAINRNGYAVIAFGKYDGIDDFADGVAIILEGASSSAYVNVGNQSAGNQNDAKFGTIDKMGLEIIPLEYDYINSFHDGMAAVMLGDKWGFVDAKGTEVVSPRYDYVKSDYFRDGWAEVEGAGFSEGMAAVGVGVWPEPTKWGFIKKNGYEVVPPQYNSVYSFSDGMAAVGAGVWPDLKWGFIDQSGREVIPTQYELMGLHSITYGFNDGMVPVPTSAWPDRKWAFIDKTGHEIIQPIYDNVAPSIFYTRPSSTEGLAAVGIGEIVAADDGLGYFVYVGKWGFVDNTGREVVPLVYDYVFEFSNGFARVFNGGYTVAADGGYWPSQWSDGKWGFVDTDGNEIVPCIYDEVSDFSEGLAKVGVGGSYSGEWGELTGRKYGMINTEGRVIVPLEYDYVGNVSDGLVVIAVDGRYSVLSMERLPSSRLSQPESGEALQNAYKAYYDFLTGMIEQYGIADRDSTQPGEAAIGVYQTRLVDFDGNGIPELTITWADDISAIKCAIYGHPGQLRELFSAVSAVFSTGPNWFHVIDTIDGELLMFEEMLHNMSTYERYYNVTDAHCERVLERSTEVEPIDVSTIYYVNGAGVSMADYYDAMQDVLGITSFIRVIDMSHMDTPSVSATEQILRTLEMDWLVAQ